MSEYNEEKVIRQNREEGYSDGYADGIEAAKREMEKIIAEKDAVIAALEAKIKSEDK